MKRVMVLFIFLPVLMLILWGCAASLIKAVKEGNTAKVQALLDKGADVNTKDDVTYSTPLYFAVMKGDTNIVRLLLDKSADVNVKNIYYSTPLHFAASRDDTNIVRLLLDKSADVNVKDKGYYTPLHIAAEEGHTNIVRLLLDKGAEMNVKTERDKTRKTPLMLAIDRRRDDVVQLLLNRGADVNIKGTEIKTGIASIEVSKEAGTRVQYGSWSFEVTALSLAIGKGKVDLVQLLLKHGADVNMELISENGRKVTPLEIAKENGQSQIAEMLEKAGAIK